MSCDEYAVPAIVTSKKGTLLAFSESAWRENRKTPQERYTQAIGILPPNASGISWHWQSAIA